MNKTDIIINELWSIMHPFLYFSVSPFPETSAKLWIWIKDNCKIKFDHSVGIAGLGVTFSNITALAFTIESFMSIKSNQSGTTLPCPEINMPKLTELYEEKKGQLSRTVLYVNAHEM